MAKSGKHTPYFELLEAQPKAGCPVCRLVYKATDRYLDSLLYEAVLDPDVRAKLKAAQGFCATHVEMLGRRPGRALGIALIYRDIIRAALTSAEEYAPNAPSKLDTLLGRNKPGTRLVQALHTDQACPACQIGAEAEHNYTTLMLEYIEDPEFQEAYAQGEGLCFPHLLAVLDLANTPDEVRNLIDPQAERYRTMLHELDEFIRKRDHRFRHEPMGDEGDVWLRAMNMIVGGAGWGLSARSGGRRSDPIEH
ncbi:MAG: DUF6062 family protein [Chloroflexi bacterium]|nr:DUF6062 family protein [Chloroflexota bacterium]